MNEQIKMHIESSTSEQSEKIANAINLTKIVSDSVKTIRPCDAWRLYDEAEYALLLPEMKAILKGVNDPAYNAFIEYEKEVFREIRPDLSEWV